MLNNLHHILRRITRERGFTATVLLTLALCIGANVTIYAVVDAVLVRSLPFPDPDRLVTIFNAYPGAGIDREGASVANYYNRRDSIAAFTSVSIFREGSAVIGNSGTPSLVSRDRISPEFFETLGVTLARGRSFTEDELLFANSQRTILTHEFWQSHFGGHSDILDRSLEIDGVSHQIVGVLAPEFRFGNSFAKFFVPLASAPEDRQSNQRHSKFSQKMIGRLAPNVTPATAQAQVDAFNHAQLATDPLAKIVSEANFRTYVVLLHDDTVRSIKSTLVLLQIGVFALLLIGAFNLVNLFLIRANGRLKEYAVRQALGANRSHLVREIMIETGVLTLVGGLLGLATGFGGIKLLSKLGTDQLPLGTQVVFDVRIALVALAGSLFIGLLLAVPVIWFSVRNHLAPTLHTESHGGTVSRAAQRVRYGFIIAQVALAFVLLSGASLLGVSLNNVLSTDPGFRPEQVLTARIALPGNRYPDGQRRQAFLEQLLDDLRGHPGVNNVGLTNGLPFDGSISKNATRVEGVDLTAGESIRTHYSAATMGDYWQALEIPLIEGRFLNVADNQTAQKYCVVDQAFVDRYWPDATGLGQRLAQGVQFNDNNAFTIVGVVGTIKQDDLTDTTPLGTVYLPYQFRPNSNIAITIRTVMAPAALGQSLQKLVLSLDPELPVSDIKVLQTRIEDGLVGRRSPAILSGIFAAVALILAAVGTYGVLAYAVGQRKREIGVRMALGALPRQILQQFLSIGTKLLAAGIGFGALGAWGAGIAMQRLLFDVQPLNLVVMTGTAGTLSAIVLVATLLPSHRASRVSPMEALKHD